MYQDAFRSLFETNMGIRSGERILVFSDTIRIDEAPAPSDRNRRERLLQVAEEAARFAETTYGRTDFVSFPATAASGAEPPETLWRSAFGNGIVDTLAAEGILSRL